MCFASWRAAHRVPVLHLHHTSRFGEGAAEEIRRKKKNNVGLRSLSKGPKPNRRRLAFFFASVGFQRQTKMSAMPGGFGLL